MLDLKRHRVRLVLVVAMITAVALAAVTQFSPIQAASLLLVTPLQASASSTLPRYEVRTIHDPNGTGRFYLGREIAQVMGAGGMAWLERSQRADEERPQVVIDAMKLRGGEVVADLGAGTGYFAFRLASKVGKTGKVLAVDIQDEMLATLRQRAAELGFMNVEEVKASETDPHLPATGVDEVLMVDAYHELAYPFEVMSRVRESLKPGGCVILVEYRKEDPLVPIKEVHKMSVEQLTKEMKAVRLAHVRTIESLPTQHIVIFEKR